MGTGVAQALEELVRGQQGELMRLELPEMDIAFDTFTLKSLSGDSCCVLTCVGSGSGVAPPCGAGQRIGVLAVVGPHDLHRPRTRGRTPAHAARRRSRESRDDLLLRPSGAGEPRWERGGVDQLRLRGSRTGSRTMRMLRRTRRTSGGRLTQRHLTTTDFRCRPTSWSSTRTHYGTLWLS